MNFHMDYYKKSLEVHRKNKGKLAISAKIKVRNKAELSVAYTPGIAEVSRTLAKDSSLANKLTLKSNSVAVISDGSAVLGLGNIGPYGALPVMEGKALLFKEFAGVDAYPICLHTQDTEEIIKTIKNISVGFGGINLEDISAPKCFEIEERLKKDTEPLEAANKATAHLYIVNPLKGGHGSVSWFASMFNTHPPIEERVKRLRGMNL
jgi:malate dehydrogenase (oxaloacetate-decarboxylating)